MDIHRFFDSITSDAVFDALVSRGISSQVARCIVNVTTVDGQLPTGFSTSPLLSNIVMYELDEQLSELALSRKLRYSRYVDDISFSAPMRPSDNVPPVVQANLHETIAATLDTFGFASNPAKTRYLRAGKRQVVTGYSVAGRKPLLPRPRRDHLKREVALCQKWGVIGRAGRLRVDPDQYFAQLVGKLCHMAQSEPQLAASLHSTLQSIDG